MLLEMFLQGHFDDSNDAIDAVAVFRSPSSAYDALLLLREDALPQAARTMQKLSSEALPEGRKYLPSAAPSQATRAVLQSIPTGEIMHSDM